MRKSSRFALALSAGILGLVASTAARALEFIEAVIPPFGDFPGTCGFSVGTLDLGANTIFGSALSHLNMSPDGDCIRVVLPDTLAIDSIVLQVSSYGDNAAAMSGIGLLAPNSGGASFNGGGAIVISPFSIQASPIEFGIGAGLGTGSFEWDTFNYALHINVVVPEPSTLVLLTLGLLGFGCVGRRTGRRSAT